MRSSVSLQLLVFFIGLPCVSAPVTAAIQPGSNDVYIRVVDVGAGLCAVAVMPQNYYMVYDAGNFVDGGDTCLRAIQSLIPEDDEIDLLILSHSDADHLGAVPELLGAYKVKRIVRSGLQRSTSTWKAADDAVRFAKDQEAVIDINLRFFEFPPGATYRFGDTFVTIVAGFHEPPKEWGWLSKSEFRNAGSIVVRLLYNERSVLFCGDAVGRHNGDPPDTLIATEQFMVKNTPAIPIDSDIIIAPHHGADNGSARGFIEAVSPEYVIFSAGHRHRHPRATTAKRYLDAGVAVNKIFRTDLGDNEGGDEWSHGNTTERDRSGDDNVDILLRENGTLQVEYRRQ